MRPTIFLTLFAMLSTAAVASAALIADANADGAAVFVASVTTTAPAYIKPSGSRRLLAGSYMLNTTSLFSAPPPHTAKLGPCAVGCKPVVESGSPLRCECDG